MSPAVAAVDWGTSSFRLWLLDPAGKVLAERRSGEGLLSVGAAGFAAILDKHLAAVDAPAGLPVVICGMAGARQGWIEAPYVAVPASFSAILSGAIQVADRIADTRIIPGLAQRAIEAPDVMRGEETQLAGIAGLLAQGRHLICMPGTHSKWVEAEDGDVLGFQTWMTGELFSVLAKHSILRHSLGEEIAAVDGGSPGFRAGVERALAAGGDIGGALFKVRAASLLQGSAATDSAATLSGLLLGAEVASAKRIYGVPAGPVILVASGGIAKLYEAVLTAAGFTVQVADAEEAVRAGLFSAARHCGMVAA